MQESSPEQLSASKNPREISLEDDDEEEEYDDDDDDEDVGSSKYKKNTYFCIADF